MHIYLFSAFSLLASVPLIMAQIPARAPDTHAQFSSDWPSMTTCYDNNVKKGKWDDKQLKGLIKAGLCGTPDKVNGKTYCATDMFPHWYPHMFQLSFSYKDDFYTFDGISHMPDLNHWGHVRFRCDQEIHQ